MMNNHLLSLEPVVRRASANRLEGKILLLKPPYFTPWTPPLGIAILKSFLEQHGYSVTCFDFNTDPDLWGMHHKYFTIIQTLEGVSINDGYSKLWWILNAHLLAYMNGADAATIERLLEIIMPMYDIAYDARIAPDLLSLVDRFFKGLERLSDEVDISGFSVVGTSTYTTSLATSLFLLRKFKQKNPQIKTVMGGGIFADDLASGSDNLTTLIEEYSFVDHIVLGEGEMLFLKLLQGELAHLRVISIADVNNATLAMQDVPSPDFSDFDLQNYYHLTIEGARSCPFQCSFCSETIQWGDYRKKPMDLFAQQVVELARRFNNNSFFMGDSLMNPYIFQFSSALLERKAAVLYDGYLRADKPVTYRDKVKLWAQSGLYRARLGIESASARVLVAMDKMTTPQTISDALKSLAGAGIRTTTYWIVGFPGETEQDFQETCEFIREHHRYIYELEAHPYYYYPYGQIGSRLYECYSIYPDEVTKHTKFRVWEVVNSNPTRWERYERLRRISTLASELGLPNIYTMAERYQAEDRWHMLHPLAIEVYDGTKPRRGKPQPRGHAMQMFSGQWASRAEGGSGDDAVLCYHVRVTKRLDESLLSASLLELIKFNEMLQVNAVDGQYVASSAAASPEVLFVYQAPPQAHDDEAAQAQFIKQVSSAMKPEAGNSVRAVLINGDGPACDVFLLAHRAIADARGVVLLLEDLYRIYEQLASGREISLRPVKQSYSDFINQFNHQFNDQFNAAAVSGGDVERRNEQPQLTNLLTELRLDQELVRRMSATAVADCDLNPTTVLLAAFLNLFAKAGADGLRADVRLDYRLQDDGLQFTAAPLTCLRSLSPDEMKRQPLSSGLRRVKSIIRPGLHDQPLLARTSPQSDSSDAARVCLDFEYMVNEPWLGDEWVAQGFALRHSPLSKPYVLEIVPALRGGITVYCKHSSEALADRLVEAMTSGLATELETIIEYCEDYSAARTFWHKEFSNWQPGSTLDVLMQDSADDGRRARTALEREINRSALLSIRSQTGADLRVIGLAAFAGVLSRLSAREEVMILSATGADEAEALPLRLMANWNAGFVDFVRDVEGKIAAASAHARFSSDIFFDATSNEAGWPLASFDVGFFYSNGKNKKTAELTALPNHGDRFNDAFKLIVEIGGDDSPFIARYTCAESLGADAVERLSSYLNSLLEAVALNPLAKLGEIELDRESADDDAADLLAGDSFNF
jgi:radical SAM superfamily enzyme YgiQ (UPF0313 family)